jgi:cytosine/adenosine deaminase-related metal-dependent hydrolase
MTSPRPTLKARYVFPVGSDPIPDGEVTIDQGQIVAVGRHMASGEVEDLGNVALLPGLVNAHAHLDLGDLARPLGTPGMPVVEWLRCVINYRLMTPSSDHGVARALEESLRLGTTAVGDIGQTEPPADVLGRLGVDLTGFLELIAPTPERIESQAARAERHVEAARASGLWHAGLSPHAPYSVHPDLLTRAVALSAERHVPLAMHLAESREELELIRHRRGPFREFLERLGAWTSELCPTGIEPIDYLRQLALAHRALVIHGNYLDDASIALLAAESERMTVVYCPRTHAYFGHDAYPLEKMLAAGVSVALGTDSRASSPDLSVLAEMRLAARRHPSVARSVILELGTLRAAAALGRAHVLGSLRPGHRADLVAVALSDRDAADPHELLFEGDGDVVAVWCRGVRTEGTADERR